MTVTCASVALNGLDPFPVRVEVDVSRGVSIFTIVGLGDLAVHEARERVWSAIRNTGLDFPLTRKTVNLAPSNAKKTGTHFDLSIAVGLLGASGQCRMPDPQTLLLGELGLDGSIRGIRGALPLVMGAVALGLKRVVVPEENAIEASMIEGIEILCAGRLSQVCAWLDGKQALLEVPPWKPSMEVTPRIDFGAIRGQALAKRALEISAVGGHAVLLSGPPGAGKSLLAQALCGILPPLSWSERLEVSMVHSLVGLLRPSSPVVSHPPMRQPHHTSTGPALIGGGNPPRPGEISLALHGVLFLDELPLFRGDVLEALREPLEEGWVHLSRANGSMRFPAHSLVVAAMNPCPCGPLPAGCLCRPQQRERYRARLSGPFLDRIDLLVGIHPIPSTEILGTSNEEASLTVKARVVAARLYREKRGQKILNRNIPFSQLGELCPRTAQAEQLLITASDRLGLSARAIHRSLRVARSVADLSAEPCIQVAHIAESLQFRSPS